ncbi:MAG TPA: mucoidy inhibitor MuiA family protein, partial [Myxococcales bacterium]|nr:mucoidy inhibitor MuiA family protein [Myxococcales bacterium]
MNALSLLLLTLSASGPVTDVVVFPDRAEVVRTAQVPCGPRAQVTFTDVSPAADPQSFRARTSAGTVEGLRSVEHTREQAFAPKLRELEQQLLDLGRQIQAQQDVQARAAVQARVGGQLNDTTVQFINRELIDQPGNAKTWIQAMDAALAARLKAAAQAQEAAAKIRALEQKRSDLQRRQQMLQSTPQRHDFQVEVLVSCGSGTATVQLHYLVGGASWEPSYEARAGEGGAVELTTLASVSQSTGEAWSGARLSLSTAVPRQNATPPEIQPLKVYVEERQEQKKVLVRRDEQAEHAEAPGGGQAAEGRGRLAAEEQGLSVQLKVPEAVDVPADGSPVRLTVATHTLKAQWSMRAVPKLQPYVFRVAELVN